MKKRQSQNSRERAKETWIIAVFSVLLLVIVVTGALMLKSATEEKTYKSYTNTGEYKMTIDGVEYEGWINCMPPLSEERYQTCKRAEEAGYEYIAY